MTFALESGTEAWDSPRSGVKECEAKIAYSPKFHDVASVPGARFCELWLRAGSA